VAKKLYLMTSLDCFDVSQLTSERRPARAGLSDHPHSGFIVSQVSHSQTAIPENDNASDGSIPQGWPVIHFECCDKIAQMFW